MSVSCRGLALEFIVSLLKTNRCRTLSHLHQLHAAAVKSAHDADPLVAGELLRHYAAHPSALSSFTLLLFSLHPSPDTFIFNTLIYAYSLSSQPLSSFQTFKSMLLELRTVPDSFSFAFLLKSAANARCFTAGIQVHAQSLRRGFAPFHLFVSTTLVSFYGECNNLSSALHVFDEIPHPNIVTWNAAITASFRSDDAFTARSLFDRMPWRNIASWNIMLAGYMKAVELDNAKDLFVSMVKKDPVSWSTMVIGYASNGFLEDAFGTFKELLREWISPNEASITGALSACGQSGAFESGRVLHALVEKLGLYNVIAVANALLDMYARCGNINMAWGVFDWDMGEKNVVSWTSMIAALAMHGHGEEAIRLFDEMEEHFPEPDGVTFMSVLYACSHAGLLERGENCFNRMKEKYGIEPSLEHYGCMVDMYGRAGLLEKAFEFVTEMPLKPNAIIWRTLLGACSLLGNVTLAEHVKVKLSEVDPYDSGDYVLLSNTYAVAGMWKNVADVRKSMSQEKMKKCPGWSSIQVDNVFYGFVANDGESIVIEEAQKKLDEIMLRLRIEGYVPEVGSVLHDIAEEEKLDAVSRHSEKLAVAFGIARLSQEKVIRIVKNLRVCRDCHIMLKLVSKFYKREIVVRDRSRFHCFKEGSCSCTDYW